MRSKECTCWNMTASLHGTWFNTENWILHTTIPSWALEDIAPFPSSDLEVKQQEKAMFPFGRTHTAHTNCWLLWQQWLCLPISPIHVTEGYQVGLKEEKVELNSWWEWMSVPHLFPSPFLIIHPPTDENWVNTTATGLHQTTGLTEQQQASDH